MNYFYDTLSFLERIKYPLNNEKIIISDRTTDFIRINCINIPTEFQDNVEVYELEDRMYIPLDNYDKDCWQIEWSECLACAYDYDKHVAPDETIFISNSTQLRDLANRFFGDDSIDSYPSTNPSLQP